MLPKYYQNVRLVEIYRSMCVPEPEIEKKSVGRFLVLCAPFFGEMDELWMQVSLAPVARCCDQQLGNLGVSFLFCAALEDK